MREAFGVSVRKNAGDSEKKSDTDRPGIPVGRFVQGVQRERNQVSGALREKLL